ncbi:MAG: UbiX family flavin prenyltransferase [Bacteroidetes bacterium]|nr:MAG: UbiX family flavin prenyltransferase [Bacteroidota bacterium]
MNKKIIIGITGASGAIYGKLLLDRLESLRDQVSECSVIFSATSIQVWTYELGSFDPEKIPFHLYDPGDFFAPMASGSAGYDTMIIAPCSMGTLGRIASGVSNDLMTRAADIMLKERRKLILVTREAPLNLIHIRNMQQLTEAGAIICPASPSFYSKPQTLDELAMTVVDRVLTLAGFNFPAFSWGNQD